LNFVLILDFKSMNLIKTNAFLNPWRWLLGVINPVKKKRLF
jgi:hypothetical protein